MARKHDAGHEKDSERLTFEKHQKKEDTPGQLDMTHEIEDRLDSLSEEFAGCSAAIKSIGDVVREGLSKLADILISDPAIAMGTKQLLIKYKDAIKQNTEES